MGAIAFFAGIVALMVAVMYYSEVCLYPSDRSFNAWRFVAMWFRELLIAGFAGAALILCTVASILSGLRRLRKENSDLKSAQEVGSAVQPPSPPSN